MEAYSLDLRERVVRACDERAGTQPEIAEMLGVSVSFITKLLQRRAQHKTIAAKAHSGGGKPSMAEQDLQRVQELVADQPDATLVELCERLHKLGGAAVRSWTMCRALKRLGLVRKKSPFTPPNGIRLGSRSCVQTGAGRWRRSIPGSWFSLMKAG
jgi:transposase